jgi:predicted ATPase
MADADASYPDHAPRLSSRNVREMIGLVAAHNDLGSESVEAVVERTGGVPLFVEELTRAALESGSGKIAGHEVPVNLHDSLMARLDLLHVVHPISEEDLQHALRSATDAELVYVRGIAPDATYQFKRALIQDAAYAALLRSRRKELHSRVADVLVQRFPDVATSAPELLAHHLERDEDVDRLFATRCGCAILISEKWPFWW